jgi:tetratricopeptide (TPR) repeat protein
MIRQAGVLFVYLGREFGPWWLPLMPALAIAGFASLFKSDRPLFWFLSLVILFDLIYALNYEIAEDQDAYYLPVFSAIIISAGYGLGSSLARTALLTLRVPKQRTIALLLVLATLASALASNFPYNNRRNYYVASDYVNNILSTMEPGAMLITLDWQVYSPLQFLHEAENLRPDVIAIDINQMRRSWYFDYLEIAYPQTMEQAREQKEAFLEDLRQWEKTPELYDRNLSLNQRISERFKGLILKMVENQLMTSTVYATQEIVTSQESRDSDWMRDLASRYGFVPQGLVFQVFPDKQFREPAEPRLEMRGLVDDSIKFEKNDVVRQKVLPVYVTMLYNRGRYFAAAGKHDRAVEAFKQALEMEPENSFVQTALNESLAKLRAQQPDRP